MPKYPKSPVTCPENIPQDLWDQWQFEISKSIEAKIFETPISDRTRLQISPAQAWIIATTLITGAGMAVIFYFGIIGQINTQKVEMSSTLNTNLVEVNKQLVDINWKLRDTVSRGDLRDWIDDLRERNPHDQIPAFNRSSK